MGETRFVVPVEGAVVQYPHTRTPLPAEGAEVPWDGNDGVFWRRRVADGSVSVVMKADAVTQTEKINIDGGDTVAPVFERKRR